MSFSRDNQARIDGSREPFRCAENKCILSSFDQGTAFGVCLLDKQLRLTAAYGPLLRRLPHSVDSYVGMRVGDLSQSLLPASNLIEAQLRELASQEKYACFEVTLPTQLGGGACVCFVSPVRDHESQEQELLCFLVDISLCERARIAKTEVPNELALLAHELRNPLATISSGLKILEMYPSYEDAAKARQMMGRQLRHAGNVIRDVFDLARIREGRLPVDISATGIAEVVDLALEISGDSIKRGAHTLRVSIDDNLPRIYVDKSRVAQALSNLLDNAAKYTPQGGIISLDVGMEHSHVMLQVSDNGLGIAPDKLAQIFDLFAQVGEHLPYSRGGLGIGLFLVKAIAEGHGGSILVHSDGEGAGSRFTLCLPRFHKDTRP